MSKKTKRLLREQKFKEFIGKVVLLTNWSGTLYSGVLRYQGPRVCIQNARWFRKVGEHGVWCGSKDENTRFFDQDRVSVVLKEED